MLYLEKLKGNLKKANFNTIQKVHMSKIKKFSFAKMRSNLRNGMVCLNIISVLCIIQGCLSILSDNGYDRPMNIDII